ncbi:hypothetical protein Rsub_09841 [Raphidocelis subcapitata]|uniref:Uncharacterized protein n=1 Tax=Raphidocelis subcapitata TaxID=307507 RepID=A0A2V0PAF3_9CHLO|nr:hypothetical protein Rsub_09841 [Raphidocelis subcapitata]|eukprot:GBF96499.1 hypothetical protein Rsub_09841 [Raphidocelis subcapitata]
MRPPTAAFGTAERFGGAGAAGCGPGPGAHSYELDWRRGGGGAATSTRGYGGLASGAARLDARVRYTGPGPGAFSPDLPQRKGCGGGRAGCSAAAAFGRSCRPASPLQPPSAAADASGGRRPSSPAAADGQTAEAEAGSPPAPAVTRTGEPLGWTAPPRRARPCGGARAGAASAFRAPPRDFRPAASAAGADAPPPTRYSLPQPQWASPRERQRAAWLEAQSRRAQQQQQQQQQNGQQRGRLRGASAGACARSTTSRAAELSARMCQLVFGNDAPAGTPGVGDAPRQQPRAARPQTVPTQRRVAARMVAAAAARRAASAASAAAAAPGHNVGPGTDSPAGPTAPVRQKQRHHQQRHQHQQQQSTFGTAHRGGGLEAGVEERGRSGAPGPAWYAPRLPLGPRSFHAAAAGSGGRRAT